MIDRRQQWLLAILLIVVASVPLLTPADRWRDDGWFRDGGLTLNTADQLLHGKKLYSDAFYQYGPASIELYVIWCKVFGNTISSYRFMFVLFMLVNCCLLFKVLQQAGLSFSTMLVASLALVGLPYFLIIELAFEYQFGGILILIVLLLWRPLEQRTLQQNLALGMIIGLMQWVRFGPAVAMLAAIFIMDLILEKTVTRCLVVATLSYLTGFFLVEGALAARLFLTLPKDVALDTIWPQFMVGSYDVYLAEGTRFPRFTTLNFFIGTQLPIVIWAVLAIVALVLAARNKISKTCSMLLIPLIVLVVNCLLLYKQAWHYYRGSWLLVLPAAAAIDRLPVSRKVLVAVFLLPPLYVAVRADLGPSRSSVLQASILPNGEKLWLAPEVVNQNQSMVNRLSELQEPASRRGVVFLSRTPKLVASHLYFFYQIPQPGRHSMIFPGWLRLRDFQSLTVELDRSKAVVLFEDADQGIPPEDACEWESHPFPHPYCEELSARLEQPIKVDDLCWIFPLSYP
jgi:hypothetical protein